MHLIHTQTLSGKVQQPAESPSRLTGIAVDAQNRLFAITSQEVKRFSPEGELEARFPTSAAGWSIAVDGQSIWVGTRGVIDRFDPKGNLLEEIEDPKRLGRITSLVVQGSTLLAADASNHTIHLYQDSRWLREVGRDVNTRGFMIPNGVLDLALDTQNQSVLVAHPQKHRVERYTFEGKIVDKFGRFGMHDPGDFGGCCNPTNITATADGLIIVSEKAPPRVKVLTSEGEFLAQSADGVFDPNTKNIDLAADNRGRLYATDPLRYTIEVFRLEAPGDY